MVKTAIAYFQRRVEQLGSLHSIVGVSAIDKRILRAKADALNEAIAYLHRCQESEAFDQKRIGLIVTAYTGICCCDIVAFQTYAETLLRRPILTHEFGTKEIWARLKELSEKDFLALARWCSEKQQ